MAASVETIETDIVVIGAGMAGAGVAAEVSGGRRVVLLELEDRPGHHSTGRSAAMFIQNYGPPAIRDLSRYSAPLFEDPDPARFPTPLLSPRGMLTVADEAGLHEIEDLVAGGEGIQALSADDAIAMVPILRREAIAAACYEPDARDIDVAALHQGFLRLAASQGVRLLTRAGVTGGRRIYGRWSIRTGSAMIVADIVVNAAGAWADRVAGLLGFGPLGLQPKRRSMAVLPAPAGHDVRRWPLIGDAAEGWYAKPDGGRLFVSPADQDPVDPQDAFVDDMVLAQGLDRFARAVTMPVERVERSWAGLRTFAPDGVPVAGFDPREDGFFWLAGQGGYGIQTAPALSILGARMIDGTDLPAELGDLPAALSPSRFLV